MFYDYKSNELVQDIITECFCPVLDDIEDEYCNLRRGEFLSIYAPSYVARELLVRILDGLEDVWMDEESHTELLTQDNADVLITIAYDGMVFVESARGDKRKLKCNESSVLDYVYDSFSNKDVEWLASKDKSILVFGLDDECDDVDDFDDEYDDDFNDGISIDCCDCVDEDCPNRCEKGYKNKTEVKNSDENADDSMYVEYSKDDDGNLHGFTASKSDGNKYIGYSVYTTNKLSKRDIQSLLQEAGL